MPNNQNSHFKTDTAQEMIDAFAVSTGISCGLYSPEGELVYAAECSKTYCKVCAELSEASGIPLACKGIHGKALHSSEQFGGRYIYVCPAGMMFSASPILYEGSIAGALIAGPVLNMDPKEFLENEMRLPQAADDAVLNRIREELSSVPFVEPRRMNGISMQLFSNAVFLSDESRNFFLSRNKNQQMNSIGEYIQQMKNDEELPPYPMDTEWELTKAVSCGDRQEAAGLLNEMLGYIFFSTGGSRSSMQIKVTELLVVLSRAAISGGANTEDVLHTTERYLKEITQLNGLDDFTQWMADIINHFASLVFDVDEHKHKNAISRAVEYIRQNYAKPITLNEVAEYVGYSHAYFSNLFKNEMGCGFRVYLNRIRIEKSKILLLSGKFSIPEICEMVGFTDQCTFGKVFKQEIGVTPGKYRQTNRRIDIDKEHGI